MGRSQAGRRGGQRGGDSPRTPEYAVTAWTDVAGRHTQVLNFPCMQCAHVPRIAATVVHPRPHVCMGTDSRYRTGIERIGGNGPGRDAFGESSPLSRPTRAPPNKKHGQYDDYRAIALDHILPLKSPNRPWRRLLRTLSGTNTCVGYPFRLMAAISCSQR